MPNASLIDCDDYHILEIAQILATVERTMRPWNLETCKYMSEVVTVEYLVHSHTSTMQEDHDWFLCLGFVGILSPDIEL